MKKVKRPKVSDETRSLIKDFVNGVAGMSTVAEAVVQAQKKLSASNGSSTSLMEALALLPLKGKWKRTRKETDPVDYFSGISFSDGSNMVLRP